MGPQFLPLASIKLNASSVASTGVQPSTGGLQGIEVSNGTTVGCFLRFGASTAALASLPSSGGSSVAVADQVYIPGNAQGLRYATRPNAYLSAITTAASLAAQLDVSAGQFI